MPPHLTDHTDSNQSGRVWIVFSRQCVFYMLILDCWNILPNKWFCKHCVVGIRNYLLLKCFPEVSCENKTAISTTNICICSLKCIKLINECELSKQILDIKSKSYPVISVPYLCPNKQSTILLQFFDCWRVALRSWSSALLSSSHRQRSDLDGRRGLRGHWGHHSPVQVLRLGQDQLWPCGRCRGDV